MSKNILVEGAYPPARNTRLSAPRTARRLKPAIALTIVLLVSLDFWWAIWAAVSSLVFG
jgi:hypothetical protein